MQTGEERQDYVNETAGAYGGGRAGGSGDEARRVPRVEWAEG